MTLTPDDWIEHDGGPLILVPLEALDDWGGCTDPEAPYDGAEPAADDYHAACDALGEGADQAWAAPVAAGAHQAIVIETENMPATAFTRDGATVIGAPMAWEDDTEAAIEGVDLSSLPLEQPAFRFTAGPAALLFGATESGAEARGYPRVPAGPGEPNALPVPLPGGEMVVEVRRLEYGECAEYPWILTIIRPA